MAYQLKHRPVWVILLGALLPSSVAIPIQAQPASQPAGQPESRAASAGKPKLYVSFTLDCERIGSECMAGGPESWTSSAASIRGFCERLLDAGMAPTLFIVPETAVEHARLFKELERRGAELGMHFHPQCFKDHRYDKYLGEYDAIMQKAMLAEGIAMWAGALGKRPRAFRPGNFSASPATFGALVELGFRHGSVSDPGRDCPRYHAVWKKATPHAHWAHAADPMIPGDLPFFEAPVTTDPDKRHGNGFPHELRIESGTFDEWHLPIIRRALQRMADDGVEFRVLSIFTHNYFDYSDASAKQTRTLTAYIEHLKKMKADYDIVPATLATIREHYEKENPLR